MVTMAFTVDMSESAIKALKMPAPRCLKFGKVLLPLGKFPLTRAPFRLYFVSLEFDLTGSIGHLGGNFSVLLPDCFLLFECPAPLLILNIFSC